MTVKQIVDGILTDIVHVPRESQLAFIKARLLSIKNEDDRNLADSLVILGYKAAHQALSLTHLVVLVHGIRTHGVWQDKVAVALRSHPNTIPVIIGFGYHDILSFLLPSMFRGAPIERVERELRGVIKDNPGARVSVIAHSFGTYLISQILTNRPDIQFHRLLLCGAIVDRLFAWDALRSFPTEGVINDVGTRDKLPVIAKLVSGGYGSSGTFGFRTHKVTDRFFDFNHSDFFSDSHIKQFWIPYLINGQVVESPWNEARSTPSWGISVLEIFPLRFAIVLFVLLLYVFIF